MIFEATEIISKTLYALNTVNIHSAASVNSPILATVQKNQVVGVVYSYVNKPEGFFWQLENNAGFVKHEKGLFSVKALLSQGAIDVRTKNTQTKTISSMLNDFAQKQIKNFGIAIPVILALIVIYVAFLAYKQYKK